MSLLGFPEQQPMPQKSPLIFTIYRDKNRQFRWRAKRGSRIIANCGEGYKRKESALKVLNNMLNAIEHKRVSLVRIVDTTRKW